MPRKLIVAGGIGASSDRRPPRRTSTVTDTRPLAAMCLAFQLSAPTPTCNRRPTARYSTPAERGSPAGVTQLSTAKVLLSTCRHTAFVVTVMVSPSAC